MSKQKKQKGIKKWAVCYQFHKTCLEGDIATFKTRAGAKKYIKELHQKIGGFEQDHHIIRVTITPLSTITKKKR